MTDVNFGKRSPAIRQVDQSSDNKNNKNNKSIKAIALWTVLGLCLLPILWVAYGLSSVNDTQLKQEIFEKEHNRLTEIIIRHMKSGNTRAVKKAKIVAKEYARIHPNEAATYQSKLKRESKALNTTKGYINKRTLKLIRENAELYIQNSSLYLSIGDVWPSHHNPPKGVIIVSCGYVELAGYGEKKFVSFIKDKHTIFVPAFATDESKAQVRKWCG